MMTDNAACLEREIDWFAQVAAASFAAHFTPQADGAAPAPIAPPDLAGLACPYAQAVREFGLNEDERIVLMLALLPHLRPQALDLFFTQNTDLSRPYTEFGGWRGKAHGGFLPTCETAAFILAGCNLARRHELARLLQADCPLIGKGILRLEHQAGGEPFFAAALQLSHAFLHRLTSANPHKPDFGAQFPAKLVRSALGWDDLVLSPEAMEEVQNIVTWLQQPKAILQRWGLERAVKPGYRSLFYGPPGTGKTLTASLIGRQVGLDVYRIDLSMVVSKYIGETEKNLSNVFDQAQDKNWILFFDEADALFGKRTQTSSANDRYANQETSYLLQRVEDFPGVVILASNLKSNIDAAFARRFQSEIYFAMPNSAQRQRLWAGLFAQKDNLGTDVDFAALAEKYELSGGALLNVARYAAIRAVRLGRECILQDDLRRGIAKELMKEGKTL